MAPALMLCWIEGGAGFFIFSVLPGGAVELPGRSRPAPGVVTFAGGARSEFRVGLYPLAAVRRIVAERLAWPAFVVFDGGGGRGGTGSRRRA